MKNKQLKALYKGIEDCGNIAKQPFRSKMMHNARVIYQELEMLEQSRAKPKDWDQFEKAQQRIIELYAIGADKSGPVFGDNFEVANKEFTELKKKHAALLSEMQKLDEDFANNVMEAEVSQTLALRLLTETELPRELTLAQCMAIDGLIDYPKAETK